MSHDRSHFLDSRELTGPVHEMAEEAINYVLKNTRVEYRINGLYREELHEIPLPALREIIINSILHRNYLSPSFIQISIHPDRIEFFSPGALHGSMTKERMLQGNSSSLRNPQLADILHRMNIVERWGSGIGRIFAAYRERNLAIPEYDVDDMGITVTIRRNQSGDKAQQYVHSANKGKRVSVTEEEVLSFISHHTGCTYSQLLQAFDISRRTLTNRLNSLMKKGKIQRSGSTRNANWSSL
ncbi:MAG: MarR family transcriptional regulator [Akkermansia sp.]|nr:MarR family transcriptional regulator [Akkermansia sp.]